MEDPIKGVTKEDAAATISADFRVVVLFSMPLYIPVLEKIFHDFFIVSLLGHK